MVRRITCPGGLRRSAAAVSLLALGFLGVGAVPAWAHGDESDQANMLVLESISLIANRAPVDAVAEKVGDALKAADTAGTDLALVRQAQALLQPDTTDSTLARADALLTSAIDIKVASGYGDIPAPGQVGGDHPPYAVGAETGTTVVLDELEPTRGVSGWGDVVLVCLGGLAIVAGLLLERHWRPPDTIRQLRHQVREPESGEPEGVR